MKLVIREYLSMLKEEAELDDLIGDLLFSMGIIPKSKPEKGRQFGVDIMAIGKDVDDDNKKVFLFVIKSGNITRSTWDNSPQAVRPSLNEILDVYIATRLERNLKSLPKKIILCCNGNLSQNVRPNWIQYSNSKTKASKIEFDFWGADKLSILIEKYLFNEFLFPKTIQKSLRKTLALLDLNDYDLKDFYDLVEELLFNTSLKRRKEQLKALKLLNLCLNVIFNWSKEANNLKPSLLASERLTIRLWDWMRSKNLSRNKKIFTEFVRIRKTRKIIIHEYFEKIQSHCYVRDALFRYSPGVNEIEYPLLTFEQIGFLSIIGLTLLYDYSIQVDDGLKKNDLQGINVVSAALINLINNNKSARNPLYDEHIIDIILALILFYSINRKNFAKQWVETLLNQIVVSYDLRKRFPIFSDSFDEAVDVEVDNIEGKAQSSTLLTVLFEWCVVLDLYKVYNDIRELVQRDFSEVDLQIWYPDDKTENFIYKEKAHVKTGSLRHSIDLPSDFQEFKKQILEESKYIEPYYNFTSVKEGFWIVDLLASRHFRTPISPTYWREYIKTNKEKKKGL